ncbi:MAG: MSMEG_1061 family FMN-dependent PPOX-type flavoprotein [Pseudomonadota bacterium]
MTDPHILTNRDQLREIVGEVPIPPREKTIDHIDAICARYIAAAPFLLIATHGADGLLDISPKGDPAGFVGILDKKTLAIPERLGNGRFDTYENLFDNPQLALIFLIPGHNDTLRVSGDGRISRDPELRARFAVRGQEPRFVLLVHVREAMTHCPKCMVRSGLWQPERWPDRSDIPTLAEAMVAHGQLSRTVAEMDDIIRKDGENRLY